MKIIVLGGSPKGTNSVTLQYVYYWEKCFPGHEYEIIPAAQRIALYEKRPDAFDAIMEKVSEADLVIWAFPLYYLMVHSSYMRFIELIFERERQAVFEGKYAAAVSTSIHFFDHTAHNYINAVCDDLGMKYIGGVPAHMHDLMDRKKQPSLRAVFRRWLEAVECGTGTMRAYAPVRAEGFGVYQPVLPVPQPQQTGKRVTIVADLPGGDSAIRRMIERIRRSFPGAELINLREIKMGPCMGCLKCGFDNRCAYEGKDDLIELHRGKVLTADILVFAGEMTGRYLSHYWQRYLERSFNRTHQPVLTGKQIAFLISGPLSQNANVREVFQGYTETMGGNLVSIVTDENTDPATIDSAIDATAGVLARYAGEDIRTPVSFLGIGGMKIFRDEIYGGLRFVFQKDHLYYRRHGIYDFPQRKRLLVALMAVLTLLSRIPFFRKKIQSRMGKMMTMPYRKVLAAAKPAGAGPVEASAVREES